MSRFFTILSKIIFWLLVVLLVLFVAVWYSLHIPAVQTKLVEVASKQLSEQLGSNVSIGKAEITWLDEFKFEDLKINDLENRELIVANEVFINTEGTFNYGISFSQFNNILDKIGLKKPGITFKFNNSLDYVFLKEPVFKIVTEEDGSVNINNWIDKVNSLQASKSPSGKLPPAFTITQAIIQEGKLEMLNPKVKPMAKGLFDYNNFDLANLNADLTDLYFRLDTVKLKVKMIKGLNKDSGLTIRDFRTDFLLTKNRMVFNNLLARFNNSVIKDRLAFSFESMASFSDFNNKVTIAANIKETELNTNDLALFAPELRNYKDKYVLNGFLAGKVNNLSFINSHVNFGASTNLKGDFHFGGLPNVEELDLDIKLEEGRLDIVDIKQYVKEKDYNDYFYKFGVLTANGEFKGKLNDFTADANLVSNKVGSIVGKVRIKQGTKISKILYEGNLQTKDLALGNLLNKEEILDKISFSGNISGKGLTIADAELSLKGKVSYVDFKKYAYKDILIDGIFGQSIFNGEIDINDPNLVAKVNGKVDFNEELNKFNIKGILNKVDLKPLGFAEEDLQIHTEFDLDVEGNEVDEWIGDARFINSFIREEGAKTLLVDTLILSSAKENEIRKVLLRSEFFNASLKGNFVPSVLAKDLNQLVEEYSLFFNSDAYVKQNYYNLKKLNYQEKNYNVSYALRIKDSTPFFDFFEPLIYVSNGSKIQGDIKLRNTSEVSMYGQIDTISYDKNSFYDTQIDFNSSKSSTEPKVLSSVVIESKEQLIQGVSTEKLFLNSAWGGNNQITFDAFLAQKESDNKGQVFGKVDFLESGYDITLNPKNSKFKLLGEFWNIPENNLVYIRGNDICFQDFGFKNKNQLVKLDGLISENASEKLDILINDFDLSTFNAFIDGNFKGVLNGNLAVQDIYKSPIVGSQLFIDELIYKDVLVGTIASKVIWDEKTQKLNINGIINRINSEIFRLVGSYDPKDEKNPLDLRAILKRTNLEITETFVQDIFSDIKGLATGDVHITGSLKDPRFKGKVAVEKGEFLLNLLGTKVYFDDEVILSDDGFLTPEKGIILRDGLNSKNTALVTGGVYNGGDGNLMLGIDFKIKEGTPFKVMNTTYEQSESFYGLAYASGSISMTGPFDDIYVKGTMKSEKNTNVTIPLDNTETLDPSKEVIPFLGTADNIIDEDSTIFRDEIKLSGVKMDLNLNLNTNARGAIIIDRSLNDKMDVTGDGLLSIHYDTRGGFLLNGTYTVHEGTYNFSFQDIAGLRKFDIKDGSYMTWSGDPYNALLDIDAAYIAQVPLKNLSSICTSSSTRVPVEVITNMSGFLSNPKPEYNITIDPENIPIDCRAYVLGFEQRLKDDEQLLFKNFASLIVFNTVFPENDIAAVLNQQFVIDQVSSLVSNKIGDFAQNLDPNLDLAVQLGDLNQNFNNASFDVGYKLSDRLKVTGNTSYSNGNDFVTTTGQVSVGGAVVYDLNSDGSLKLNAFSRSVPLSNYSLNASSGSVISYGVNVQFTRDFNSFFKPKYPTNSLPPVSENKPKKDSTSILKPEELIDSTNN